MIHCRAIAGLLLSCLLVSACDKAPTSIAVPGPEEIQGQEIGYYCNMNVAAHKGPKGQIFLAGREQPLWFSSARDTIAFTLLPEEPRNISAVYVSDMGRAKWDAPQAGTWVEARDAWYVVGSARRGGMGAPEPVPFALKAEAEAFSTQHGGQVFSYPDIPHEQILGFDGPGSGHASSMNELGATKEHGAMKAHGTM